MNITDTVIDYLITFIQTFLPASPFQAFVELAENSEFGVYLSWVNWFVPVYTFIPILQAWLLCVALYYAFSIILRWLNVID